MSCIIIILDNICYNADYQPILIDLDRVYDIMQYRKTRPGKRHIP